MTELTDSEKIEYRKIFIDELILEFPELKHNSIELNEKVDFLMNRLINYHHEQFLNVLGIDSNNRQNAEEIGLRYNQPFKLERNIKNYDFGIN